MYSRCKFIISCLAASIVCNYDITIVLSRNSAGGCHCITFSDSGRVPGTTEEDPQVQAQSGTKTHSGLLSESGTKNMFLERTNSYQYCPGEEGEGIIIRKTSK